MTEDISTLNCGASLSIRNFQKWVTPFMSALHKAPSNAQGAQTQALPPCSADQSVLLPSL
jgi:hypothetical protein